MNEKLVDFQEKIVVGQDENSTLPESLLEWLIYPNQWVMERDSMQMQNDLLQAERDELLDYVLNLKKLAIYLYGCSNMASEHLSKIDFSEVEKKLPGYLRKEIEIDISALIAGN